MRPEEDGRRGTGKVHSAPERERNEDSLGNGVWVAASGGREVGWGTTWGPSEMAKLQIAGPGDGRP